MKPAVFNNFKGGLDLRRDATTSDPRTLQLADDCFITADGTRVAKRPSFALYSGFNSQSRGLIAGPGALNAFACAYTFTGYSTVSGYGGGINEVPIVHPTYARLLGILFAEFLVNRIYVVGIFDAQPTPQILHFWVQPDAGQAAWSDVQDASCPHTAIVAIAASKVFAVSATQRGILQFSATLNGADWSTEKNSGFIDCGSKREGSVDITGLGLYRDYLVVFFNDGLQLWHVDPDPEQMYLVRNIESAGMVLSTASKSVPGGELYYLSSGGIRSVAYAEASEQQYENDIGAQIDKLIPGLVAGAGAAPLPAPRPTPAPAGNPDPNNPAPARPAAPNNPLPAYPPGAPAAADYSPRIFTLVQKAAGRVWFFFGKVAMVHTLQKASGNLSAWQRIRLPYRAVAATARPEGVLVLDENGKVTLLAADFGGDYVNGGGNARQPVTMRLRTAFVDEGAAGIEKFIAGLDYVCSGGAPGRVRVLFDFTKTGQPDATPPVDPAATAWSGILGNSAMGHMLPVEVTTVAAAVDVEHSAAGEFYLDAIALQIGGGSRRRL